MVGDTVFSEEIERLGRLFELVDFRPMCKVETLLGFQVILHINEHIYLFVSGLWLFGWARGASNPGGNCFLSIVHTQRF